MGRALIAKIRGVVENNLRESLKSAKARMASPP